MVAADDRIAVGKSLSAAGIVERLQIREVFVTDFPDHFPVRIHFDGLVSVSQIDQRMAVFETDGGNGQFSAARPPRSSMSVANCFMTFHPELFFHFECQQMWGQIIAVR